MELSDLWYAPCNKVILTNQIDSFLGATLQISVTDAKSDKIIEGYGGAVVLPTKGRKVIAGRNILTNNSAGTCSKCSCNNTEIG